MQHREVQPFWKQPIIWPVWLLFAALVYYLWSNELIYDSVAYVVLGVVLLSNLFIFFLALETIVDDTGVSYRMRPIHRKWKKHAWQDIAEYEVRQYRPLREYGGFGIRIGLNGKAYNVKGKMGLQLVLKDGKRILIGTQKAEELKEVLARLRHKQIS